MYKQPIALSGDRKAPKLMASNFDYDEVIGRAKRFQQVGRPVTLDRKSAQHSHPKVKSAFDYEDALKRARDLRDRREPSTMK